MLLRRLHLVVWLIGAALAAPAARAQANADAAALAQLRFQEGRALMDAQRYDAALERLLESERLDSAPGTLANIAFCYEKLGQTSAAWATYKETARVARADGRPAWAARAEERAAAIEGAAPRLVITLSPDLDMQDLSLALDGVTLPRTLWSAAPPVSRGLHAIRVEAAGHRPWSSPFDVDSEHPTVAVPRLEPIPEPPPPPPRSASPTATPLSAPPAPTSRRMTTPRIAAVALAVGAGVGLGASVTLAVLSKVAYDASASDCAGATVCSRAGTQQRVGAIHELNAATLAAAVSGAAFACAGTLWWAGPRGVRVGASASGTDFGLVAEARW